MGCQTWDIKEIFNYIANRHLWTKPLNLWLLTHQLILKHCVFETAKSWISWCQLLGVVVIRCIPRGYLLYFEFHCALVTYLLRLSCFVRLRAMQFRKVMKRSVSKVEINNCIKKTLAGFFFSMACYLYWIMSQKTQKKSRKWQSHKHPENTKGATQHCNNSLV